MSGQRRGVLPWSTAEGHAAGEIGDAELFRGADVTDAEVFALGTHHHHAQHQIVDVAEAARFGATALDRERNCAARELSSNMRAASPWRTSAVTRTESRKPLPLRRVPIRTPLLRFRCRIGIADGKAYY
jgi:hypothetical protein